MKSLDEQIKTKKYIYKNNIKPMNSTRRDGKSTDAIKVSRCLVPCVNMYDVFSFNCDMYTPWYSSK